ncbi:MAG: hypothetical protein ACO25B_10470 [Chitinophagaceae bacterium]
MKQLLIQQFIKRFRTTITLAVLGLLVVTSYSFTMRVISEGFLKQLGISKTEAEQKISRSILGGFIDQYGVRSARNIAVGNRGAVVKDLLSFTKNYVHTDGFIKEYNSVRESQKPCPTDHVQTPDELQKTLVEQCRKAVTETEACLKKADPSTKKIYEDVLSQARANLKGVEDPNNPVIVVYRSTYPELVKMTDAGEHQKVTAWEKKYPANHLLYIKERLHQFLDETRDIDFTAEVYERNGKKYFKNPVYEGKGSQWKMAYRAGREVVEPARTFVEEWVNEMEKD